jgi:hypothetical protein
MISKIMKPRRSISVQIFGMPILQLGDIVNIDYKDEQGIDQVTDSSARFVVYQIDYSATPEGPDMTVFLSEVS